MTWADLRDWWPLVQALGYILVAIVGFGWRQVGKQLDRLTGSVDHLTTTVAAMATTTAVVQTQLQAHTEMDRQSFHEVRNDLAARLLDVNRRLDAQRQSLETVSGLVGRYHPSA